jgi:hypothetical protein
VLGLAIPAVLCTWGAIHVARGPMAVMAILPGALALGLFGAAFWAARTASFSMPPKIYDDPIRPPAVLRWLKERSERAAGESKPVPPSAPAAPKPPQ